MGIQERLLLFWGVVSTNASQKANRNMRVTRASRAALFLFVALSVPLCHGGLTRCHKLKSRVDKLCLPIYKKKKEKKKHLHGDPNFTVPTFTVNFCRILV